MVSFAQVASKLVIKSMIARIRTRMLMYPQLSLTLSMFLIRVLMEFMLSSLVHHGWAQRRKPYGCQIAWLLTFKDPSKFGYLKGIDLLL